MEQRLQRITRGIHDGVSDQCHIICFQFFFYLLLHDKQAAQSTQRLKGFWNKWDMRWDKSGMQREGRGRTEVCMNESTNIRHVRGVITTLCFSTSPWLLLATIIFSRYRKAEGGVLQLNQLLFKILRWNFFTYCLKKIPCFPGVVFSLTAIIIFIFPVSLSPFREFIVKQSVSLYLMMSLHRVIMSGDK